VTCDNSLDDGLVEELLGGLLEVAENHGRDLFGSEGLGAVESHVDLNHGLARFRVLDDGVGQVADISLHAFVGEALWVSQQCVVRCSRDVQSQTITHTICRGISFEGQPRRKPLENSTLMLPEGLKPLPEGTG
jgi:hypothetical protein